MTPDRFEEFKKFVDAGFTASTPFASYVWTTTNEFSYRDTGWEDSAGIKIPAKLNREPLSAPLAPPLPRGMFKHIRP